MLSVWLKFPVTFSQLEVHDLKEDIGSIFLVSLKKLNKLGILLQSYMDGIPYTYLSTEKTSEQLTL